MYEWMNEWIIGFKRIHNRIIIMLEHLYRVLYVELEKLSVFLAYA